MVENSLTVREEEILALVARGNSNKEIAKSLNLSVFTVQTHLSNINQKLGVACRTEAASFYWKQNVQAMVQSDLKSQIYRNAELSKPVDSNDRIKMNRHIKLSLILGSFTFLMIIFYLRLQAVRTGENAELYFTITVNGETKNFTVGDVVATGIRNKDGNCIFPEIEENSTFSDSIRYASTEYTAQENCELIVSSIVLQSEYVDPEPVENNGSLIKPAAPVGVDN